MMRRTISIKLLPTPAQAVALSELRAEFAAACNHIVPLAVENRCWNRVALHHLAYYPTRDSTRLGSQMVCNAVATVSEAYKALSPSRDQDVPVVRFRPTGSVHFDKRTYSIRGDALSLYTLGGRILVPWELGGFQQAYLRQGVPKEAELVCRGNTWFFNLVLDIDPVSISDSELVMGVDVGENNLAATSTGKVFGGGSLRFERDVHLAFRRRLQSNGSQSARHRLQQVSGCEQRHVRHINHVVSKAIVAEAKAGGAGTIAMEDLTHIRRRIKAGKRIRARLHRWPWRQLQSFVAYKAEAAGIRVLYVDPAYTSQTCSVCGLLGQRTKHRFECSCGSRQHADVNAASNLCRLATSAEVVTGPVNVPYVAVA